MAMIPLIAFAGVVQMAMLTGGYGDNDVSIPHQISSSFRCIKVEEDSGLKKAAAHSKVRGKAKGQG